MGGSAGGSSAGGKPSSTQARGPLEALRDEIFGGFSLPTTSAPAETQPVLAAPVTSYRQSVQSGGGATTSMMSSPTPSIRERTGTSAGQALQDEHSTITTSQAMHSVADLSSIYSMPESAMNAAANTPMSFTTAAVSELDTPSSPRSHGEEDLPSTSPRGSARGLGLISPSGSVTPPAAGVNSAMHDISSGA
ncbi:hypothetical protein GPECTOR_11g211 [Gonium pectorale]|uniref:Uncharacterized protein n=1 Tax=Gonium pectorale TaxID=33097 RepID=A0A150GPV8_GONPE|nr:hypothetical protein GPECTOR_11g211 [Gonium pectorale]|eukprot:KXZ51768.1 hypothetical protein GPECTOR_11g211 [Gonium pectorale]